MGSKVDYVALATRLRGAYALRSARTDAARPARLAEGRLPLDDVLRYLDTERASGLVGELTKRASRLLAAKERAAKLDPTPDPFDVFGDRYLPTDPFDRALQRSMISNDPWIREVDPSATPRLVVEALATAAGDDGLLSRAEVEARLGPIGARIMDAVEAGLVAFKPGTERPKLKYEGLSLHAKRKVALSAGRQTFVERMPAFRALVEECPGRFAGFEMASVQHLFPSTMALYDALEQGGLGRPRTGVGGKNYSANPDVTARMEAEGWDVAWQAHPTPQSAGLDAEKTVFEMAKDELSRLFRGCNPKKETKPRFLILDDGGKLIRCLHEQFPAYAHLCVAVEQTDRGIQIIDQMAKDGLPLRCPVVDMARAPVKKQFEAPMIGEAIVTNAAKELSALAPGFELEPKTATVLGFGAVGEATARALLRRGFEVHVYDPSPEAMARAAALGCAARPRDEALGRGKILFSCTGRTTLTPEEFTKLPSGAVLVNGASGNHELGLHAVEANFFDAHDPAAAMDGERLRSSFGGRSVDLGDAGGDRAMLHRVVRQGEHEVLALRSGYVINMTDGLPPEYVQLVLGLLYASCAQAVRMKQPGLVALEAGPAAFLEARTEQSLTAIGKTLATPDFEGLASWRL